MDEKINEAHELLNALETLLADIAGERMRELHFDLNCEAIREELCECFNGD